MTGQPLEDWLQVKFKGVGGEFGDDISGSTIERLTLFDALSVFRKIKFSHILIGLAAYEECLNQGTLLIENIWNEARFAQVREVMLEEATQFI